MSSRSKANTLFTYDCDCVLIFENHPGAQDARGKLVSFCEIELTPTSATSSLGHRVPATSQRDPTAPTTPQTKNLLLLELFISELGHWIFEIDRNRQKTPTIQCFKKANFQLPKIPTPQIDTGDLTVTRNTLQTPKIPVHQKIGHYAM